MKLTRKNNKIIKVVSGSLWDLPSPTSMSYFWNFGSTLGICLAMQILTGILLTLHYTSFSQESFNSVIEIMREIWGGWIIRFMHMNGASVFFFFIYLHLFRGMFFMSSVHKTVWMSGVSILLLLMGISFLGYVLPWGQMSYWGVAVITSLLSVTPLIGESLTMWIWGSFSVDSPTLTRFYSFHYLLPFVLSFLVIVHLFFLHENGSSNNIGINSNMDKLEFHPYFSVKDFLFIVGVLTCSIMLTVHAPYTLGDPLNSVPADPMMTPPHIQPEWYFLASYSVLRSMPSKGLGVLALGASVAVFYLMPLYQMKFSVKFNQLRSMMFWLMIFTFFILIKIGANPAIEPWIGMAKAWSILYFFSIFVLNI